MNIELSNAERFISWIKTKSHLNLLSENASKRIVKRGQVYWCHFGINVGSEMSKTSPRPAIIIQNHTANKNSSNTIVVPVTHNKNTLPCLVPLSPINDESGQIILDGQANTANIVCVSKARLLDLITTLSPSQMKKIDKSIAISLELMKYHENEAEKYDRLTKYTDKVKAERNTAQDQLNEIREMILQNGFDEISQNRIKKLLDI